MKEIYRLRLQKNRGLNISSTRSTYEGLASENEKKADKNTILEVVFKKDPNTGKPVNDLALVENLHLSSNVREFIKQNLQAPVEPEPGIKDYDLALELARKPNESVSDYKHRLSSVALDSEKFIKTASLSLKKAKKLSDKK